LYGYLFAQSFTGSQADLDGVAGPSSPVRFATVCYAGSALFAALQGETAADIAAAARSLELLGAGGTDVAALTAPPTAFPPDDEPERVLLVPPKFSLPRREEAFVRVRLSAEAHPGFLEAAAAVSGVIGVALVAGRYDALVECGAATYVELVDVVDAVRALPGISTRHVALAHLPAAG
jgi:hypothetical protein